MPVTVRDEVIPLVFRDADRVVVVMEVNASRISQRQDGRVELRLGNEGQATQLAQRDHATACGQPHDPKETPRHLIQPVIAWLVCSAEQPARRVV
ncbi:MAG: hypothetical protein ACREWE_03710 [Gammaproteobacteria bacterium]